MQISRTIKLSFSFFISIWFLASCSTSRNFTAEDIKPMNSGKVIRKVSKETPTYKTYESKKVTINYQDHETKSSFSGQFKINRDNRIILSLKKLTMPVGRGMVTNDSLFLINYFEKYYIEEKIETLQKLFGLNLDYMLLQALLTADVSSLLHNNTFDKDHTSIVDENMYRIDSELNPRIDRALNKGNDKKLDKYMKRMDESEFIRYSVWVDPEFFVIRKLSFTDIKKKEELTITFDQYELVARSLFPQQIKLQLSSSSKNISLEMKLSRSTVNKTEQFNFSIPNKYEKFKVVKN